jgi:hypothetical protein
MLLRGQKKDIYECSWQLKCWCVWTMAKPVCSNSKRNLLQSTNTVFGVGQSCTQFAKSLRDGRAGMTLDLLFSRISTCFYIYNHLQGFRSWFSSLRSELASLFYPHTLHLHILRALPVDDLYPSRMRTQSRTSWLIMRLCQPASYWGK